MNQQFKIIIFIGSLFIISSVFLFYTSDKYLKYNHQTTWWSAYFENPKDNDFNFVIENHSDKEDFKYEVFSGEDILKSENINVAKGEIKKIDIEDKPSQNFATQNIVAGRKITIKIYSGDEKREIYKNL